VPILISAVKTDRDPAVRITAIKALAQIGPPAKAAIPALQEVQKLPKTPRDQDKELAKEAEAALEKIQGK
jgi:HEAT repeat protein